MGQLQVQSARIWCSLATLESDGPYDDYDAEAQLDRFVGLLEYEMELSRWEEFDRA